MAFTSCTSFGTGCRSQKRLDVNLLLQGYLPLPASSRATTLARKRQEYLSLVELAFARNREGLDQQIWHQIEIDVPRTRPGVKLWMHGSTQRVRWFIREYTVVKVDILFLESRTNTLRVGYSTPGQWIRSGY